MWCRDTIVVMSPPALACTVRGCGLPLERHDALVTCPGGHAFDVARSGYINLLQPQDRRSPAAGDSREAVGARARLLAAGIGRTVLDAFVYRAVSLDLAPGATVVDIGSGTGDALADNARQRPISGVGIDLSTAAAEHAARRFPHLTWAVANADRRLPLADGGVALILSLHARRNAPECARVLAPGGYLLVATPAHDDLVELRESVMGERRHRDRADALLADHEPFFALMDQSTVRERRPLERDALLDLLRSTYRGGRSSEATRVAALQQLDVTLASDFFLFQRRTLLVPTGLKSQ